jgi:hypothetical protein
VRRQRIVGGTLAVMLGCFGAGYAKAAVSGSGAPVAGTEIADALVGGIPGHPLTTAACRNTHVGDVTSCAATSTRIPHVRLRVTVRRLAPLSLLVDTDRRQARP